MKWCLCVEAFESIYPTTANQTRQTLFYNNVDIPWSYTLVKTRILEEILTRRLENSSPTLYNINSKYCNKKALSLLHYAACLPVCLQLKCFRLRLRIGQSRGLTAGAWETILSSSRMQRSLRSGNCKWHEKETSRYRSYVMAPRKKCSLNNSQCQCEISPFFSFSIALSFTSSFVFCSFDISILCSFWLQQKP